EYFDSDLRSDRHFARRAAKFADKTLRLTISLDQQFNAGFGAGLRAGTIELGDMTANTAANQTTGLITEAQLHRLVTITISSANLQHGTRASFDDRDRDRCPSFVENLSHPDLTAEYTDGHRI